MARARPAAGGCILAAAGSMEALALVEEHTVEALAQFALSNYVKGPNVDSRSADYHYYCRAAGSNSYYSCFVLYILKSC